MTSSAVQHDPTFWGGKRVVVTGHTGFKGAWLTTYLVSIGAQVMGVSLPGSSSEPDLWTSLGTDIAHDVRRDVAGEEWGERVVQFSPHVVLHLAAQALVSVGYDDPELTFRSNVVGTLNLMSTLNRLPDLAAAVVVTTDKVYDTRQVPPFDETAMLGGADPYAASKAAVELIVLSWPSQRVRWATARAGNVIGGGDWSRDRIVPDLVRAWTAGDELVLRRPDAVRPWQHVVEPLMGYLVYCERIAHGQSVPLSLNFGPSASDAVSVAELVEHGAAYWSAATGARPAWHAVASSMPETHILTLNATASHRTLGLTNRWTWRQAVDHTLSWYLREAGGETPRDLVLEQFAQYLQGR